MNKEKLYKDIIGAVSETIKQTLNSYDIFEEDYYNIMNNPLYEMSISSKRLYNKFSEVVGNIIDNLICICLYPNNPTVPHWKERSYGLCQRFIDINLDNKNTFNNRYKILNKAVIECLDNDYKALLNHFKNVSIYYANRPNIHDRLTPYKSYQDVYNENKDRVVIGILKIIEYVAYQDYEGLIQYMNNF